MALVRLITSSCVVSYFIIMNNFGISITITVKSFIVTITVTLTISITIQIDTCYLRKF